MIRYGLKLWSDNEHLFDEAYLLYQKKRFDFIELYHNAEEKLDFDKLKTLQKVPVIVHAYHSGNFHEFNFGSQELEIWKETNKLADFFKTRHIIVHPGKAENIEVFKKNLKKVDDSRILIENMVGLDIYGKKTFGYNLEQLKEIKKVKNICFDLEKAIKSACYQNIDYKKFISDCLELLQPFYFHISGGDVSSVKDEHLSLWESNFDIKWMRNKLDKIAKEKDIFLVFEVPKNKNDLKNDVENINYFKNLVRL